MNFGSESSSVPRLKPNGPAV